MGRIRLACMFCDRNEFDGVDRIPGNWFSVAEEQSYEESLREAHLTQSDVSAFDWFTHLGVCPECYAAEIGVPLEA